MNGKRVHGKSVCYALVDAHPSGHSSTDHGIDILDGLSLYVR